MQAAITEERYRQAGNLISEIEDAIAAKVGSQKYRIWFKNSTRLTLSEGYLKVGVPNLFIANWIENHFSNELDQAIQSVTGENRKVTFVMDPELAGRQRQTQLDSQAQQADKPENRLGSRRSRVEQQNTRQLRLSLDTFVVGPSNQLAYNTATAVVNEEKSPFNPLFIHGGYGVGKTHLLQGICNAVCGNRPKTNWLYLSAEDFVNQFVLALKTRKLEAFRRRLRQTDLLAIDDIHFLASKPSTQEEFLHTFNTIDLAGKQVVMVSDAHPKMIGQLSDKLVNRFLSGMVVKIDTPDFQTRCRICEQFAVGMGKRIPKSVIKYIAENLRSNVRELQGALLKLTAFASLQNKPFNSAMAKEVLAEHLARTDPIVHISDIESVVATYFGVTPANIHSSKKDRTIAMARHYSMYLARKHTNMSFPEIGRYMGGKNHATVILACKKVNGQTQRNAELRWQSLAGNRLVKAKTVLTELERSLAD